MIPMLAAGLLAQSCGTGGAPGKAERLAETVGMSAREARRKAGVLDQLVAAQLDYEARAADVAAGVRHIPVLAEYFAAAAEMKISTIFAETGADYRLRADLLDSVESELRRLARECR